MPFKNPHPLYHVWQGMKRRCDNPNFKQFADYGGRGIKVCPRWINSFENFVHDMGERPDGHSIDRIDNDGPYSPENCRWVSRTQQQRNQRRTRRVVLDGKEYVVAELVDRSGLKSDTIMDRARKGLTLEEVLSPEKRVFKGGWEKAYKKSLEVRTSRTHCKHGHRFTPENTHITKQGWRRCRACARAKMRRLNAAKRAKSQGL